MNIRTLAAMALSLACLALSTPSFAQDSTDQPPDGPPTDSEPADFNRKIYFKNKLEFSFDSGHLDYNTDFIFKALEGETRKPPPHNYVLIPLTLSLRWHLDDIGGPWILRGNTDLTIGGNYTVIARGPETYYASFMVGGRYNFVQPNWRVAPYLEGRLGLGFTDAKGPKGVLYAQGQDFTFTFSLGGGLRYNFNPRYSASLGVAYMHVSNLYLSLPEVENVGINVVGPTFGVNIAF